MKNKKFFLALIVFSLVGQIAWVVENMYFNVFIYKMFNASANDISLMVEASAVAATLTTVFIGALSDRLGKRRIFMCLGYILWGVSIMAFAFIRLDLISAAFGAAANASAVAVTAVIILDCVMTFFGSSANDAAYNAWLTDRTDETNRGRAEGINSMMPLLAILVVFGGFMGFDLNRPESWTWIYVIIGALVLVIGALGFFLVEDAPAKKPDELGYFKTILYGFRPSVVKKNRGLYFTLAAFIVFGISIQIFMPYLIIYYEKTLGMSNYVLVFAPAIIGAAVVTALYGKVYDRKGFMYSLRPVVAALGLGYVLLYFFRATVPVFIGSLLMLSGYLMGMSVFGAMIRDNIPENRAGQFQGVRIIGQVFVPGLIGPAIGAAVLKNAQVIVNSDGTTSFLPDRSIWVASFAVLVLLCLMLFLTARKLDKKPENV